MVNGRQKGHAFERSIVKLFKDLGWDCVTSRYGSKELDDKKVDLCRTDPFLIQAKAVEKLPKGYHDIIQELPDEKGKYRLLFHKKNRQGTIVSMELDTFKEIVEMLIYSGVLKPR